MDVQTIAQLITSIGFPIVACCFMAWYCNKITEENNERVDRLNEAHKEEIAQITEAITNNTIALNALSELLRKEI